MSELVTRAQIVMLARILHVPAERIVHLERLGADNLLMLRERMSNLMFDENAEMFRRVSALIPVVPLSIAMPIVQKVVDPEMSGRTAGAVSVAHPKKSVAAMSLLKPEYGASAAPFLDPRAVLQIAHLAPPGPVVAIAKEILRRKDYVTGGLFVEAATPELIRAVEAGIDDDEGLMLTAAYVHSGEVISSILRVIIEASPQRLSRLIATTADGTTELRLAVLSVISRIEPDLVEITGDVLFGETAPDVIASLIRTFTQEGAAHELLTYAGNLSSTALDTFAHNSVLEDQQVRDAIVGAAATETDPIVWRGLLRLLAHQDDDLRTTFATALGDSIDSSGRAAIERALEDVGLADELQSVTDALLPAG